MVERSMGRRRFCERTGGRDERGEERMRPSSCRDLPREEWKDMMQRLREVDFSMAEVILYLDVYPHCGEALAMLAKLSAEKKELCRGLAEAGYPVTASESAGKQYHWIGGPWPWDPEAN